MTPPHSPLPWTVNEAGDIIDADGAEMVIAEDGAIYPEDRRLIVTAVNNHARLSCDLATARRELEEERRHIERLVQYRNALAGELESKCRETDEMRERTIEECSRVFGVTAEWLDLELARHRALSAQPDSHKEGKPERKSMTETLMNPDEAKFWDTSEKDGGK